MVSMLSLAGMIFSLLLIFMVPLGLVIYFYRKEKIYLPAVLVGAQVFLVFQLLTRIPLINYFSTMDWFTEMAQNIVFLIFFFALTAGIFEEIGRYRKTRGRFSCLVCLSYLIIMSKPKRRILPDR